MLRSNPVNPDLLDLAPLAARVLELGCGVGRFAEAYRARNPTCRYVGIEADSAAAEIAEKRIDRVLVGTLATVDPSALVADGSFDLILASDIREHLREGDAALARLRSLLAPGGHVALCLPNGAHWPLLEAAMRERSGLSASMFTGLEKLSADLTKSGFRPIKQRPRRAPSEDGKPAAWLPPMAKLAATSRLDRAALVERSQIAQHVLVAARSDAPPIAPIQLTVAAMAPRFMDVRARLPAAYLRSAPDVGLVYQEKTVALSPMPGDRARILLLQRPATPDKAAWLRMAGEAFRAGWLVVTEYDDHPELVGKVLGWAPERARWLHIAGAHAVQTTTDRLAAAFRAHNPEVMAFPNAAFTLPALRLRPPGPRRVFFGALNRGAFSAALAQALGPAIAAHPDTMFEVVHDRSFFDALPTERKRFWDALDYERYLAALGNCDIALLPLAGEDVELFKSDVKYVESASRGAAVIASPAVYGDSVVHEGTGLIAPSLADWAPALGRLLGDDGLRDALAHRAWIDVRDHRMFAAQVGPRVDWYRRLWTGRERLHAALLERCPWLVTG